MKTMLPVLFFTILCLPLSSIAGNGPDDTLFMEFEATKTIGCDTLTTTFTDLSFADNGDDFVVYTWDFGDGTITTPSPTPSVTHKYLSPGVYNVTMSVVTLLGNHYDLTMPAFIQVEKPLTADFTSVSAGGCSPIKTDFTQTSAACGGTVTGWSWDFGDDSVSTAMNPSHNYASPGTYTVKLTVTKSDLSTFTVTKPVVVSGVQSPIVELGPDQILCDGSSVVLSAGNPGAVIDWSTWENTPDITVYDGDTYYVSVTKDGCTTEDSVKVIWKPDLWSDFSFAKAGGCLPVDYQFTDASTSCSGTITDWFWEFGDGSTSSEQNPLHTYTTADTFSIRLTVTDQNFNTITRSRKLVVAPVFPTVNLGTDTTICFGEPITFDALHPGATYAWSTGESSQQITVADEGDYSVVVTVNGCQAKDTVTVNTASSVLSNWGWSADGNCLPVTVTFTDSSAAHCGQSITGWNWDFGDGTTSGSQNPTHIYTTADSFLVRLTVTSSTGNSSIRTKKIVVTNTPQSVDIPATVKVCRGGSVQLDAGVTGAVYNWSPSFGLTAADIPNPILTPIRNSWYSVSVTKCMSTTVDSVYVTLDSIPKPVILQEGNILKAPDATSYKWYRDGKLIEGSLKTLRVDKAGYYTVASSNALGCENTSEPYFYIPVSGNEKSADKRIKCMPNPTTGVFNILLSDIPGKAAKVTVYDGTGKRLLMTTIQNHTNRLNLSKFRKGMYYVEVIIDTDRRIMPLVIQ